LKAIVEDSFCTRAIHNQNLRRSNGKYALDFVEGLPMIHLESRKATRQTNIGGSKKAASVQAGAGDVSSFCQADFSICETNSIIVPRFSRGTHFTLFRKLFGMFGVPKHDRFQVISGHPKTGLHFDSNYLGIHRSAACV
jgi:hypothetical protein